MKELYCPICKTLITVKSTTDNVICNKCLVETGNSVIMIESPDTAQNIRYLGDGLFERKTKD